MSEVPVYEREAKGQQLELKLGLREKAANVTTIQTPLGLSMTDDKDARHSGVTVLSHVE
jgi:hypothetical protein